MGGSARSSVQSSKGTSKHKNAKAARGGKHLQGCGYKLSSESYAIQFPAALPVKQVVYSLFAPGQWRQAGIVHCRRRRTSVDTPGDEGSSTSAISGAEGGSGQLAWRSGSSASSGSSLRGGGGSGQDERRAPKPSDYDYYMHWIRMDRRLDDWRPWEKIRALDVPLPPGDEVVLPQDIPSEDDDHAGMDEDYLREHEEMTKVKTIGAVVMGGHYVQTWYYSPYPKEFQNLDQIYICDFCLTFFRRGDELSLHESHCKLRHPPGSEIFRDEKVNKVAMWEIDGALCRVYCENLCYLSKLFLDHKTLRHPVHLFLFYVLAEIRDTGFHIVGYFSKEKYSRNNLSCILTLPQHQRKGYGKLLISFSYALSIRERKRGTPERPLSDLGKASYICYWTHGLLNSLKAKKAASIEQLADETFIEPNDIAISLHAHDLLKRHDKTGEPFIFLPPQVEQAVAKKSGRPAPPIGAEDLRWESYDAFLAPFEFSPNC